MVEQEMIGDLLVGLNHLGLTLPLDLEDVGNLVNVTVELVLHITSVVNVGTDYLVLRGLSL